MTGTVGSVWDCWIIKLYYNDCMGFLSDLTDFMGDVRDLGGEVRDTFEGSTSIINQGKDEIKQTITDTSMDIKNTAGEIRSTVKESVDVTPTSSIDKISPDQQD